MTSSLLNQLLEFYKSDPSDPFTIYGLALEYQKTDQEKSEYFYSILLNQFPDYLPTYYHAGKFYQAKGSPEKAKEVFTSGILLAEQKKDFKAIKELKAAYNFLLEEEEDW